MTTFTTDERVTGQNSILKWGEADFSISNVSWSRDINTTEVQHNDDLTAKILTTGLRFSGSFDYNGRNWDLMNSLVRKNAFAPHEANEPVVGTLTVVEEKQEQTDEGPQTIKYTYTFTNVLVTSQSRDLPADDVASSSWDWQAESMSVSETIVTDDEESS